jgi:Thioredoxin-like [2Fe-2S] ferredoxin
MAAKVISISYNLMSEIYMSKRQKLVKPLMGQFLGWGDDRIPHRYVKLATANGEQLIKVGKNLRLQIQDWQPGSCLALMIQERIDRSTGESKSKIEKLLMAPAVYPLGICPSVASASIINDGSSANKQVEPNRIRVCQGSICRRQGSEQICRSIKTYLDRHNLTDRVTIESVKCLHQCKAAPQAIVTSSTIGKSSKKSYHRHIKGDLIFTILDRSFSIANPAPQIGSNLIQQIGTSSQHH